MLWQPFQLRGDLLTASRSRDIVSAADPPTAREDGRPLVVQTTRSADLAEFTLRSQQSEGCDRAEVPR